MVAKGWLLSDASAQSSPPYTHTDRTKSIRVRLSTCLQATHVCITSRKSVGTDIPIGLDFFFEGNRRVNCIALTVTIPFIYFAVI